MEYVNLGRTGTKVSRICLGCMTYGTSKWRPWVLDEEPSRPFFRQAWEAGINFFDTADMYSDGASEVVLGRALRELAIPREQMVVATKVYQPMGTTPNERGLSAKHIRHSIDNSLKRLQLDYVDLYQIHRFDPSTPVEETLGALDAAVRAGKVLYIGASSMFAWQLSKMLHTSDRLGLARFITMQNHWNLVYREEEREVNPLCRDEGLGLLPWSPLARGFLAGNRRTKGEGDTSRAKTDDFAHKLYYQDTDLAVVDRVAEIAQRRGVPNAQVALAWLLHQPGITAPIIGASKPHHLTDAIAAAQLKLEADELKALEDPYRPHPVLGHS
ncbi:aldo keto reductase : Aldo/keto reductase OS=Solibacter usitatus (strain Ellin6076) GN=Acid_1998 PE=4 SV=1: Aldo_ket_red [Gemmata massiliana]|uniref:NADP-dependent oxidoreductase domain-containing protein n=1 Tax=Gemmata massiliana TaxID=1210884 RepID=A0A6P2CZI8_9BACT|nr:aldo/keto reductase [Gemmata massiliana]VTR93545.1 aldo keto reductase : Aldo/keto reductase OS=Solibacter usitatus (strain Ellin6076) GN=Acid_1998 PE=4 SV=1: Aldo_ket_red [Gemmata massiliana]